MDKKDAQQYIKESERNAWSMEKTKALINVDDYWDQNQKMMNAPYHLDITVRFFLLFLLPFFGCRCPIRAAHVVESSRRQWTWVQMFWRPRWVYVCNNNGNTLYYLLVVPQFFMAWTRWLKSCGTTWKGMASDVDAALQDIEVSIGAQ